MSDPALPSLHFSIWPGNRGCSVRLSVSLPPRGAGPVSGRAGLTPLAACLVRFRIEALREQSSPTISVYGDHFGDKESVFQSAWHFLKNARGTTPDGFRKVQAGWELDDVSGLKARQNNRARFIEVALRELPRRNVTFSVYDRNDLPYPADCEAALVGLFEYLVGRMSVTDLWDFIQEQKLGSRPVPAFRFGNLSTKTLVVHRFRGGLSPQAVTCRVSDEPFAVPAEVEALIDDAHRVLRSDAPSVRKVGDKIMFAPQRVVIAEVDLDSGTEHVEIRFIQSSYRYYAAFAFAELLSKFDRRFDPLVEFSRRTPEPTQPAPATCSMGVRVLVETSDGQFVVCHRTESVKLNPNVWSVSANEGLRDSLLTPGRGAEDLLAVAVERAVSNELRIAQSEHREPVLLSIYHNEFNQWGAGFWMKSDLGLRDIVSRQPASIHHWEHRTVAGLPVRIEACGRAMRDLGVRWYGGALETLCTALSWRELAANRFISPEEIGVELSKMCGGAITPIDEANPALVPKA